jgi:hypothetical protein
MPRRFEHFGEALRHYRETYQDRIRQTNPDMPRIRITALALIDCMDRKGYSISSGAYSEIEAGISIPKDPQAFIVAAASCLAIPQGSADWETLHLQLAFDVLAKKLGEEYAQLAFRDWGLGELLDAG